MAITKHIRIGQPSDGGDITEASTFKENLEGGTGPSCTRRIFGTSPTPDKTLRAYDIKKAVVYRAGDWTIFLDWANDGLLNGFDALVVVTDAAGATLRTIATFFSDGKASGPNNDKTKTVVGVAAQTLLATERLCLIIRHGATAVDTLDLGIDNFSASCNTRLVTPDEAVPDTLINRLAHDGSVPNNKEIPGHNFGAALFLWASGDRTRAQTITALELDPDDEVQLDEMVTSYNALSANKMREFGAKVEAVSILLQDGKLTKAEAKTILGMT